MALCKTWFKVRVVQCSQPNIWYRKKIGCEFEVQTKPHPYKNKKFVYQTKTPGLFIYTQDCEIL